MRHFQVFGLVVTLLIVPGAWPQGGNSTVRGSVRDQAQAVIPNATVTLTNINTNVARTTQTNEAGIYVFPGVIPGSYRLVGEFAGMQRFVPAQERIRLLCPGHLEDHAATDADSRAAL